MKDLQSKHSHFQPFNAGLKLTDDVDGGNMVFAHAVFLVGLIMKVFIALRGTFAPPINSEGCTEMVMNIMPFILTVSPEQDNGG